MNPIELPDMCQIMRKKTLSRRAGASFLGVWIGYTPKKLVIRTPTSVNLQKYFYGKLFMLLARIATIAPIALVAIISGCASTPAPMLSEEGHRKAVAGQLFMLKCGELGYMDPATAALGLTYEKSGLAGLRHDAAWIEQHVQSMLDKVPNPTQEQCNQTAIKIAARKQQIDINNQSSQQQQNELQNLMNNRPRHTYCNKIGTQTLCNTY